MTSQKDLHLEEDQLLKAVVDETDLSQSQRDHLLICRQCREVKERIEEGLTQLGQMAERFSPSPKRRVSLPAEKPQRSLWWSWQTRTALGAAVAAIFIGIVGIPTLFENKQGIRENTYTQEMLEAEEFMTEVSMLAENALPQEYLDITGETDEEPDEEFMEFITPIIEDESWSYDPGRKGGDLC